MKQWANNSENPYFVIAIAVLNQGLRPFLVKWHPRLQDWEGQRLSEVNPKGHELNWSEVTNFQSELTELRENLIVYAKALAAIACWSLEESQKY